MPPPCRTLADWSLDLPPFEVDRVVELADAIAAALDAPWLVLDLAASVPRGAYGVKEFAVRNAPTLGEAGARLVRYQRLSNDAVRYEAEADPTSCALLHGARSSGRCGGAPQRLPRRDAAERGRCLRCAMVIQLDEVTEDPALFLVYGKLLFQYRRGAPRSGVDFLRRGRLTGGGVAWAWGLPPTGC